MNWKQQIHFVKLNTQPVRWQDREEPHYHSRFQHVSDVHQFTWCDLLRNTSPYLSVSILWLLSQFVFNKELIYPIHNCYILSLIHTTASGQLSFFLNKTSSTYRLNKTEHAFPLPEDRHWVTHRNILQLDTVFIFLLWQWVMSKKYRYKITVFIKTHAN